MFYKVSNKNNMTHINLLSWIQEQDYDAWLALYEYLEPIIMMRRSLPRLRRDECFHTIQPRRKLNRVEPNFDSTNIIYICGIKCFTSNDGLWISSYTTKDDIFKSVKAYSNILIKKSWTKGRMIETLVQTLKNNDHISHD